MNHLLIKNAILAIALTGMLNFTATAQWKITGNSGTNSTTNFVGTTDNKDLVFRTNNSERMRILSAGNIGVGTNSPVQKLDVSGNINIRNGFGLFVDNHRVLKVDSANANLFLGNGAGSQTGAFGFYNTGTGYKSLSSNTSGSWNTATGFNTLLSNTTGTANTASGSYALQNNTTGGNNTATGYSALLANTTGTENTASGVYALLQNSTGFSNTASGSEALYSNTTGISNTAAGAASLFANTIGSFNTANGVVALYYNTSGNGNTADGYYALHNNTTGENNTASGVNSLYHNSFGTDNTAVGDASLYSNYTGGYNSAMGDGALFSNYSGYYNTAIGTDALYNNYDSYYNCAIGYLALAFSIAPGWNNTAVGSFAGPSDNLYNTVSLGEGAFTSASNQARIGNSFTTSIGGYTNWTNISDGRVKKKIKENVPGLTFINKLKPVTYNLDLDAADKILQLPARKDKNGRIIEQTSQEVNDRATKQQIVYTGFVAQDVENAAKELNYDFSGVDAPKNDKDLYGLRYAEFVVPLVKAVQELSKGNDEKDSTINDLEVRISKLEALVSGQAPVPGFGGASLEQNIPNPFANSTTINYTLPQKYSSAQIIVTDKDGVTVRTVTVSGNGQGAITIDLGGLSSGTYQYSMIIDGQKMATRQLILMK